MGSLLMVFLALCVAFVGSPPDGFSLASDANATELRTLELNTIDTPPAYADYLAIDSIPDDFRESLSSSHNCEDADSRSGYTQVFSVASQSKCVNGQCQLPRTPLPDPISTGSPCSTRGSRAFVAVSHCGSAAVRCVRAVEARARGVLSFLRHPFRRC